MHQSDETATAACAGDLHRDLDRLALVGECFDDSVRDIHCTEQLLIDQE